MLIPSDHQIRKLHERLAPTPEAFELVHTHCEIVSRIAEQLITAGSLDVDVDLVRAGCLLHDIGVYRLTPGENYLRHGLLGHEILHELGFPDALARFCSCHTGVGLTRDDIRRQNLPLPVADYLAETEEETLVMYADKFHSKKSPPTFLTADSYTRTVRRFGEDKVTRFQDLTDRFGEPDLAPLAAAYGHHIG
ncbi:MAG: HDIG domain-containing metalloprotein [Actinoplanes sp.]